MTKQVWIKLFNKFCFIWNRRGGSDWRLWWISNMVHVAFLLVTLCSQEALKTFLCFFRCWRFRWGRRGQRQRQGANMRLSANVHCHCAESRPEERRRSRRRSAETLQRGACTLASHTHVSMCSCKTLGHVSWLSVHHVLNFFFLKLLFLFFPERAQRFESFLSTQLRTLCFALKLQNRFPQNLLSTADDVKEDVTLGESRWACLWCVSVFTHWNKCASYMSFYARVCASVLHHWPGDHCWVFPCSKRALGVQL